MTDESLIGHVAFGFIGTFVTLLLLHQLLALRQKMNLYGAPRLKRAKSGIKLFAGAMVVAALLFLLASMQAVHPYALSDRMAQAGMILALLGLTGFIRSLRGTIG